MECFFHSNVPSIARCGQCDKPICATCRDEVGTCPSCRLSAKIDSATTRVELGGRVPPRMDAPQPQPQATVRVSEPADPVEMRALVALGYPLWPLALLGLFDRKKSNYLKRQAIQAIGFNIGFAGFWGLLSLFATYVPILGISAGIILPFLIPLFLVAATFYGIKVWHGDDVRVPIISDWLDERLPANP